MMFIDRQERSRKAMGGGFTIVELLVALIAASILAITAGVLIFSFFKSMQQSREDVELQRDGAAAMAFLNHKIRESRIEDITTIPTPGTLIISNRNETGVVVSRILQENQNLVFDPNTAVNNDQYTIIEGRLEDFTPFKDTTIVTNTVTIALDLVSGETREEIRTRLRPRIKNAPEN